MGRAVGQRFVDHVKLRNAKGECVRTLEGHTDYVQCLAVHEGKLVSGGNEKLVRVWGYT